MLKFHAIKCQKCLDTIYSVNRRDFRSCSCGDCYIDGDSQVDNKHGFRWGCVSPDLVTSLIVEVDATKAELFYDYNQIHFPRDYGLIKG